MMPKSQLSMGGTRKKTSSGVVKRPRTSRTGQLSPNQGFSFLTPTPKPAEKRAKDDTVQNKLQLNQSIEELTGRKVKEGQGNTSSDEGNIVEEIMSKITAGCDPKEDSQEDNQIATITMNVIKLIVPVIVQAMQTTAENAVKESLKIIPEVHESNVRILAKRVNDKALTAKYERDDLEQQGRKDSLRLYGVSCPEDETNEALITTVVDKISQAEIDISESDISVCHRQGKKVAGKQPILVKFARRNKRNEVLDKKKKLREKGLSVQEDLTQLRARMLKLMVESDVIDSVRVTNGKLYAYKREGQRYVKIGCVTNPHDLSGVGIDVDYEYLGLAKYMVEGYESEEDDEMEEGEEY